MNSPVLPVWRRTPAIRFGFVLLAMLPALALQAMQLDPSLVMRLAWLGALGAGLGLAVGLLQRDAHAPVAAWALDAISQAALLAALWPSSAPLWPAIAGLITALTAQRLLGGWPSNPFPPSMLALAVALALLPDTDVAVTSPLPSDAVPVALAWLGGGIVLSLLRLRPWWPMLLFALPLALASLQPDLSADHLIAAAIATAFIANDRLHLPANPAGQYVVAALAGLGTAALWLAGAAPATLAYVMLLAGFLAPWIEHRTLPRPSARNLDT